MTRRTCLSLAALGAPGLAAQDPVIRVDVQLVRHLVTVKDAQGRLVGSLQKEDFTVLDSGVPQSLSLFERQSAQPLSIALLVDASGSTAKEKRYELESVSKFLRAVVREGNPQDAVSLYSFNWEVRQHVGYTRDVRSLDRLLRGLELTAGTSMYDALTIAGADVGEREGRHVVVVVTDGGDTASVRTYHDALRALHGADAVLYAVVVMPITNDAGRNIGGENALTTLSRETGGRTFAPSANETFDQAFQDILRELRTQYLLGYYPQNLPEQRDRFRRVQIKTRQDGLRVSSRAGYFAG